MSYSDIFRGKTVLVTGHTGFKGTWLCTWLLKLGARVVGFSNRIPTTPSMFEILKLSGRVSHCVGDVRDLDALVSLVDRERPDFVIHLAAQAIVSESYRDPVETVSTNVVGTMHVLESLRRVKHECVAVLITSDKAYDNVEWPWGYRENDRLGGRDVYSGSKGAAELIIRSYVGSFFDASQSPVRIGVGRAGNVIGGGDWARDRIVADAVRAWSENRPVEIRSPKATRPWQHVLEPLSGYLTLAATLFNDRTLHGEAYNFGPRAEQNQTVLGLLIDLSKRWGHDERDAIRVAASLPFHEAGLLKLNCDKALFSLKWEPNLTYEETVGLVGDWYIDHFRGDADMFSTTINQIEHYESLGRARKRIWAQA